MTMEQLTIQYKGMASQPSDYLVEDGNLNMAVNLEMRDGSLHAARVPRKKWFHCDKFTPRFIHNTSDGREIVLGIVEEYEVVSHDGEGSSHTQRAGKYTIGACDITGDRGSFKVLEMDGMPAADKPSDISNFCAIGNLVSLTVNGVLMHMSYNDWTYNVLEHSIPFIPLHFDTLRVADNLSTVDGGRDLDSILPNRMDCLPEKGDLPYTLPSKYTTEKEIIEWYKTTDSYKTMSDLCLGTHNKVRERLLKDNVLMYPVMLVYAIKLYDGSYVQKSNPILLFPVANTVECKAKFPKDFPDMGEGDERISTPSGDPKYHFKVRGMFYEAYRICMQSLTDEANEVIKKIRESYGSIVEGVDFFLSENIYTINPDEMEVVTKRIKVTDLGEDLGITTSWIFPSPQFETRDLWQEIPKIGNFYLVKSVKLEELTNLCKDGTYLLDKSRDNTDLTNYTQKESITLTNVQGYTNMHCEGLMSYNSRLIAYGIRSSMLDLNDMDVYCPTISNPSGGKELPNDYAKAHLYSRTYNKVRIVVKPPFEREIVIGYDSDTERSFPILFMYPSLYCTDAYLGMPDNKSCLQKNMTAHKLLVMSYIITEPPRLGQLTLSGWKLSLDALPDVSKDKTVANENLVKASDVNNPFVFSDGNSTTCGKGKVKVVAANTQPISQGQFGQYPIFAFCSDGVYAIGIGGNGTIQNCVPYSTDVITDAVSLCNVGRDIVFVSRSGVMSIGDEGRKMLLSADKNATYAFDDNKQSDTVHAVITNHYPAITIPSMANLYKYLTDDARIAFDYQNRRLIVFNPKYTYSYLMDMDTQQWTVLTRKFVDHLNPVAQCLMVDADNETVYDYSTDDVQQEMAAWLSTRAIKLGAPDLHKTIRTMIQRGQLHGRDAVGQLLYGSRDMINWYPIRSSITSVMRGFGGSGYKYFRVFAFLPQMTQKDSLYGCSVGFDLRMTSRMR